MSDTGFGPGAAPFWRFCNRHLHSLFAAAFRLDVQGSAPPGPCIIAANHFSHLDPVIVGQVMGPIRYLAVDELYGMSPFFDRFTLWCGAIPMSRVRAPLGALKEALRALARGTKVGLFPEGRRVWTWGEVAEPKRGAAWLAVRAGVPLVPVALWGTQYSMGRSTTFIKPAPVAIHIGPPLDAAAFDDAAAATEAWRSWMATAVPELRRRVLGRGKTAGG